MPPTALLSTIPPNTSMPGTTFMTSAARLAVSLMWFLRRMPRMPFAFASCATSMSSRLRPKTSGCECSCMSITPPAGLTFGGGGGKAAAWAKTGVVENAESVENAKAAAAASTLFIGTSPGWPAESILHLAEEVGVDPAHRERFRAVSQAERDAAGVVVHRGGDLVQIHDRAAMHLREAPGRELREEILERDPDQRLAVLRHHGGVLVVGPEIAHLLDRDHLHGVAGAGAKDAEGFCRLTGFVFQDQLELRNQRFGLQGAVDARFQALDASRQALGGHGLQQVVDGREIEGFERELVVGGDENDRRGGLVLPEPVGELRGDLEPGEARHADVEKCDPRPRALDQPHRLEPVGGDARDPQLRPRTREGARQLLREQRFVLGDDRDRAHSGIRRVAVAPPCELLSRESEAAGP